MAMTWTWRDSGDALHVSTAAGTLTLSFDGHSNLSFDGEGRLVGAWYDRQTYRRSLDNRILMKWSDAGPPVQRRRRFLSTDEARIVVDRAYDDARRVQTGFAHNELTSDKRDAVAVETLSQWLAAIYAWDWHSLDRDAARFHGIYKPVSILPPDQYLALVLQATEGCSYNECSFCTFYRDRRFRIKGADEFTAHIDAVRSFMGRGLFVRRNLFLADANAIVIPQARLIPLLDTINRKFAFDREPARGVPAIQASPRDWSPLAINAFVSAPDALRKSVDELRALASRHVRTLYVGLESGHDALREFLRKPGRAEDVLEAVQSIKQAGLQVGLIFMVGAGGVRFQEPHLRDTIQLIQRMPLGAGDLLYVSPFVSAPDSPYLDDMARAGYSSLTDAEVQSEERRFREALLPLAKRLGLQMSRYDIREFVY